MSKCYTEVVANLPVKYNIIAIIGEAGSGKDSIMQRVVQKCPGLHEIVSCTTRPKRDNEKEGVNYIFLKESEFAEKVINMEMLEATSFNGWFYGTSLDSLDATKVNIGVFNPAGIEILMEHSNIDLIVYRIKVKDSLRLIRQLQRESDPDVYEVIRRFKTDEEDFYDLDFPYIELINNTYEDLDGAVEAIVSQL